MGFFAVVWFVVGWSSVSKKNGCFWYDWKASGKEKRRKKKEREKSPKRLADAKKIQPLKADKIGHIKPLKRKNKCLKSQILKPKKKIFDYSRQK